MKLALAAAVALCAAPMAFAKSSPSKQASTQSSDVRTELRDRARQYDQAWGHPKQMAEFYTTDAVIMDPMGKVSTGRSAIERSFSEGANGMFRGTSSTTTLKRVRELGPNLALADFEQTVSGMKDANGQSLGDQKFHATILGVREGGKWMAKDGRLYQVLPSQQPGVGGAGTRGRHSKPINR